MGLKEMNFKDKAFVQPLLLVLAAGTGLLFPSFVKYLFGLAILTGLIGGGVWYNKEKKKQ